MLAHIIWGLRGCLGGNTYRGAWWYQGGLRGGAKRVCQGGWLRPKGATDRWRLPVHLAEAVEGLREATQLGGVAQAEA